MEQMPVMHALAQRAATEQVAKHAMAALDDCAQALVANAIGQAALRRIIQLGEENPDAIREGGRWPHRHVPVSSRSDRTLDVFKARLAELEGEEQQLSEEWDALLGATSQVMSTYL